MNDAQTWTVIGGFLAALGAVITMVPRLMDAKFAGFESRIESRFDTIDYRFQTLARSAFRREDS